MKDVKLSEEYLTGHISPFPEAYITFSEQAMRLGYDSTENVNAIRDAYKACMDAMNKVALAMDEYKAARRNWLQTEKEVYKRMADVRMPEEEKYRQGFPHRMAESAQEYGEIAAFYKLYYEFRELFTHNCDWRF